MAGPQQTMPLGEYLLSAGLCTQLDLDQALNAQVVYGGKLGTILLEQGAIDLRGLAQALGKVHRVRALDPMQPIRIRPDVIKLISPRLAKLHSAVPLGVEGKRMFVLIMDPANRRALEGISMATGREVVPVILPEVRLRLLLERYYGIEQDLRFLTLAQQLAAHNGRMPKRAPRAAGGGDEDLMPEEVFEEQISQLGQAKGEAAGLQVIDRELLSPIEEDNTEVLDVSEDELIPLDKEEGEDWSVYMEGAEAEPMDLSVDTTFEAEDTPTGSEAVFEEDEPLVAALTPIELAEATRLLDQATDRDHIAEAVTRLAMRMFKRSVLFIVRQGRANGWDAFGDGMNVPVMKNLIVWLRQPSVFKLVVETKAHFLGAVPPGEINEGFLKLLGGKPPRSVFLYPILFQGRVVNLIYGDGGPGRNAPVDVSDLLIVGPRIPQAFGRILRERRRALAGLAGGGSGRK